MSSVIEVSIALILCGVFLWWWSQLRDLTSSLSTELAIIDKTSDVDELVESRDRHVVQQLVSLSSRDEVFGGYCEKRGLSQGSIVIRHLKVIFDAGWSDTRLEASELNRHTEEQLFRKTSLLKSVLGVFIIIGLFGTLIGLISMLSVLSQISFNGDELGIKGIFSSLVEEMWMAFVPSVTGIFLTIVGICFYSQFLHHTYTLLKNRLDHATIDIWIPKLYPTTSRRVLQTLEEAQNQLRENMNAAHRVADFAKRTEQELSNFGPNIQQANGSITAFNKSIEQVAAASKVFDKAMGRVSDLQKAMQEMSEETKENTRKVGELFTILRRQNDVLAERLGGLKAFEELYREGQRNNDQRTQELLVTARNAIEQLGSRNQEILQQIGGPINTQLSQIDVSLNERLSQIESTLRNLQNPVADTAKKINDIADVFTKRTERLIQDLHQEFSRQNQRRGDELGDLRALNTNLVALLNHLKHMSENQLDFISKIGRLYARGDIRNGPASLLFRRARFFLYWGIPLVGFVIAAIFMYFRQQ